LLGEERWAMRRHEPLQLALESIGLLSERADARQLLARHARASIVLEGPQPPCDPLL
jgi:hypothetical protein